MSGLTEERQYFYKLLHYDEISNFTESLFSKVKSERLTQDEID